MNNDTYQNNQNVGMDWDDVIESDGQEYVLLPEGDYNFIVSDFERGHFPGSTKMTACNMATLTLQVRTDEGVANVRTSLILNRVLEWKVSSFFRCIGQKKSGERLVMNWNRVVGSKGRAHFKQREYVDRDGNTRQANEVDRFYDYDEKFFDEVKDWKEITDSDPLPW